MFKLKKAVLSVLCLVLAGCCSDETREKLLVGGAGVALGTVLGSVVAPRKVVVYNYS